MPESPPPPELFVTADGSPTLTLARADGYRETMHHRGGALTESLFIYGEALARARAWNTPLRVISVGLGLGYNELITLAAAGPQLERLWSFESLAFLREQFQAWTEGRARSVVDDVAERVARHFALRPEELRTRAREARQSGRLDLRADYPADAAGIDRVNVIYFDAFSNKMDPHLWGTASLTEFFAPRLDRRAVFSTYAATGDLNRALRALNFRREKKRGFMGRRQSTLAWRDERNDDERIADNKPVAEI